jgi:hypothetical protein
VLLRLVGERGGGQQLTIFAIEFPTGIPPLVLALPVVESWYENAAWVCISESEALASLRSAVQATS